MTVSAPADISGHAVGFSLATGVPRENICSFFALIKTGNRDLFPAIRSSLQL
jgi:hypothetical protein